MWKRGSLDGFEKSTMAIVSFAYTRCEVMAALALANSCGSTPIGAAGAATGCAGTVAGAGVAAPVEFGTISPGSACDMAAEERMSPAPPAADRRNISLRFNDIQSLRS